MTTQRDPNEWMAEEIFKTLSGLGHRVFMYDKDGQRVFEPAASNKLFSDDAKMMIVLDWTKGKPARPHVVFHTSESTDPSLLDDVRNTLKKHNLYDHSFSIQPYGKILKPKHFARMNRKEVTESAWSGSTRTSRWPVGTSQVVIRHRERLLDCDQPRRWTRIASIFVHGADGTRYPFPFKNILGAKAMAQHMHQGSQPWDQGGQSINFVVEKMLQLSRIKRWANSQDATVAEQGANLQAQLKSLLMELSDDSSYPSAVKQAQAFAQMMQEMKSSTTVENKTMMFKEARELERWFSQFDSHNLFENQDEIDITMAVQDEGSTDPREIVDNLSRNVTGWESRFEENPMEVLSQIEDVLAQIKNLD